MIYESIFGQRLHSSEEALHVAARKGEIRLGPAEKLSSTCSRAASSSRAIALTTLA